MLGVFFRRCSRNGYIIGIETRCLKRSYKVRSATSIEKGMGCFGSNRLKIKCWISLGFQSFEWILVSSFEQVISEEVLSILCRPHEDNCMLSCLVDIFEDQPCSHVNDSHWYLSKCQLSSKAFGELVMKKSCSKERRHLKYLVSLSSAES